MKKRIFALTLAALMTLSATGCTGTSAPAETKAESKKIALCVSHQTNAFIIAVTKGAVEKGKELGVTVDVFDGKQDQATQAGQVEQAINQGYDGILIEPVSVDGVVPAVKQADEAGIPVITVIQKMKDQENLAKSYCGGNDAYAGELEMEKAVEALGGQGNIAVLYGPMGSDNQIIRKQGYDKVLEKNPNVKVVFAETANWVTEEALTLVENWLQTGTPINAIVAQNDGMAMGALKAVEDAGLQDKIKVYGIDAVADAVAATEAGRLAGTISQDAAGQGALGVETMMKVLSGEKVEPINYTQCIWIDKANAKDFM